MPSMTYDEHVDRMSVGWLLKKINRKLKMSLAPFACAFACDMKNIGKPCAGEPHARFDEGGQAKACSLLYPFAFAEPKEACFAAGTLVWTDQGLVPIEQIKVGDMVLSKPEDDDSAPTAYKRVTDTSSREEDVGFLECFRVNSERECGLEFSGVVVTYEHPFWANRWESEGWGWHPFNRLMGKLRLQDGGECEVSAGYQVRQWLDDNGQPVEGLGMASDKFICGRKIDFHGSAPVFDTSDSVNTAIDVEEAGYPETNYFTKVFNLTVEDYHTYYVGEWGFWVHNACFKQREDLSLQITDGKG